MTTQAYTVASMAQFQLAALIHRSISVHQFCFIKTQNSIVAGRQQPVNYTLLQLHRTAATHKYQTATQLQF